MAKTVTGVVTSNRGDKTIVIAEHVRKTHPLYKKQYTITNKFIAHDEKNECSVGDKVVIEETRPISRRKHYKLKEIIEQAELTGEALEVIADKQERPVGKKKSTEEADEESKQ